MYLPMPAQGKQWIEEKAADHELSGARSVLLARGT